MPNYCYVRNCASRSERDAISFYRLPKERQFKHVSKVRLNRLRSERREKWRNAINRVDLTGTKLKNARVCSKHFISGKPAKLEDVNHPDWIPNVELGYHRSESVVVVRVNEALELAEIKNAVQNFDTDGPIIGSSNLDESKPAETSCQTDIKMSEITENFSKLSIALERIDKLSKIIISYENLRNDDTRTRYFTNPSG